MTSHLVVIVIMLVIGGEIAITRHGGGGYQPYVDIIYIE